MDPGREEKGAGFVASDILQMKRRGLAVAPAFVHTHTHIQMSRAAGLHAPGTGWAKEGSFAQGQNGEQQPTPSTPLVNLSEGSEKRDPFKHIGRGAARDGSRSFGLDDVS